MEHVPKNIIHIAIHQAFLNLIDGFQSIFRQSSWPALAALVVAIGMAVALYPVHWTGPVAVGLIVLVLGTLAIDLHRAVAQRRRQFGIGCDEHLASLD